MRQPYFYVIQHKRTGIKYAGCKWARDADPSRFMLPGGYTTSSKTVNLIIGSEGLASFKTLIIKTEEECGMPVYEYETRWLNDHQCAQSNEWFNRTNNHHNYSLFCNREITRGERLARSIRAKKYSNEVVDGDTRARLRSNNIAEKLTNTVDPETGLTLSQLRALKTANTKRQQSKNGQPYYAYIGSKISDTRTKVDPNTGLTLAQLAGQKTSRTRIEKGLSKGENNPMYGKKGSNHPKHGHRHSEETRMKQSRALKGMKRKQSPCPHCNKMVSKTNLIRWHGDNCKHRPIESQ